MHAHLMRVQAARQKREAIAMLKVADPDIERLRAASSAAVPKPAPVATPAPHWNQNTGKMSQKLMQNPMVWPLRRG